jgi:conjugal transfer/entry exclusion protein
MDAQLVEATIKTYLTEIRSRLDKAAGIGRAADACAGSGFHDIAPALAQSIVFDPNNYAQNVLTAARELQQINHQITAHVSSVP